MHSTPSLRFPEFSGEWREVKLGDIANKITTKNKDNSISVVLTNSATLGVIPQRDYFDKDIANESNLAGYYIVAMNDFVYNPRISTSAPVGPIKRNRAKLGVMSPLYTIFRFREGSLAFYEHYFDSRNWHKFMKSVANYGARHDRMNIKDSDFFKMPLPFPPLPEQQKIADFLTAIDEKITLTTDKISQLETYKRGMMQKLLSGELRFPRFSGEWEKTTIGKYCDILDNKRVPLNTQTREKMQGDIPYYGANGVQGYINDNLFDETLVLIAEDGGHFYDFHNRPIAYIITGKSWINNHVHVLRAKNGENRFLYYSLVHKNITPYINGGTRAKLNRGELVKIPLIVPPIHEQQKIADFLTSLDDKLTLEKEKLDQLKRYKQGLLQRMFV